MRPQLLDWTTGAAVPPLCPRDRHIWRFSLDQPMPLRTSLGHYLQPDEVARFASLRFAVDRERATVARGVLRELLGQYLGIPPSAVHLTTSAAGKPELENSHHSEIKFNLSHSGEIGLIVVARHAVGVDLERIQPELDPLELADASFSQDEIEELRSVAKLNQREWFFHGWVRKEALLKALGCGLSIPLDSITVILNPMINEQHFVLRMPLDLARYTILRIDPHPGYAGAVAFLDETSA